MEEDVYSVSVCVCVRVGACVRACVCTCACYLVKSLSVVRTCRYCMFWHSSASASPQHMEDFEPSAPARVRREEKGSVSVCVREGG